MNCRLFLLAALIACAAFRASAEPNPAPVIIPAVRHWEGSEGSIALRGLPLVIGASDEKALRPTAEVFAQDLADIGLPKPEIIVGEAPSGKPCIALALSQAPFGNGIKAMTGTIEAQAYAVEIAPGHITITGHNQGGVFAGTRSVLHAYLSGGKQSVPCGKIVDAPETNLRCLMLDAGRKAFPMSALYDYLRALGWYKMNVLHLHLSDVSFDGGYGGFRVQCDTFPGLTSKDCFYTKKELREFQDRAAAMGIMVLPEFDMPGHSYSFVHLWPELAWNHDPKSQHLDVNNPEVLPRMKQVVDEMIPIFDAPYFHIGTDEYRVKYKDAEQKQLTCDNFRKFINEMNAYIRSKGKECVVWDGWEHMPSSIEIDPTVVVDMWWGIFDTNAYLARGHKVLNSNQGVTYLTSGRPVYGVNNAGLYGKFKANHFGKVNPPMDAPGLLGAKLNVWHGQGPTGWTMTEIAGEAIESVRAISEALWGRNANVDYATFLKQAAPLDKIPGLTVLDRLPGGAGGVLLDRPQETILKKGAAPINLPLAGAQRADLEFPWTLTMEVRQDEQNGRGVILSSKNAEVCAHYTWDDRKKAVNAAEAEQGREKFVKVTREGFGLVRATGNWKPGATTPADTTMAPENSRVFGDNPLPLGEWVKIRVVAEKRRTRVFINDQLVGDYQHNPQAICPLERIGSPDPANSFVGAVRNLHVIIKAELP
jgi:hexosaminidase